MFLDELLKLHTMTTFIVWYLLVITFINLCRYLHDDIMGVDSVYTARKN